MKTIKQKKWRGLEVQVKRDECKLKFMVSMRRKGDAPHKASDFFLQL